MFFVDAAHFVLAPFLGYLWTATRRVIKAPTGRKRFNVLAAIDAVTHELFTITNDAYINSESVCKLLWKLYNLNLPVPITLVLDNASYQRCKLVQYIAEKQILFLKKGYSFLVPLLQKDLATTLSMNPSSISRILSSKYIRTPHGVVPLKLLCPRSYFGKTKERFLEYID